MLFLRTAPGTLVVVPPGAPHTFANPGDEPAVLLTTFTPDHYIQYFRELRDANVRRKRVVSEVIRAMRRGSAATSTQTDLEGLVRRQLDRERRWTNPRRPTK